jgi:hypothetical protein
MARDMGTAHLLFPPGITDIRELPAPHFDALRTSLMFLGFEEMPEDEAPPKKIWLDGEALTKHFKWLKEKRKAEMNGNGSQEASEPMKENSLAKQMIVS